MMKLTRSNSLFPFRKAVRTTLVVLFVCMIGAYTYHQSREYAQGPQVRITSPAQVAQTANPTITVTGEVGNISSLFLNGRQIFVNDEQVFSETLLLYPGYNIINVTAEDSFGRSRLVERTVFRTSSLELSTHDTIKQMQVRYEQMSTSTDDA